MPKELAFAVAHGIVEDEPIEQKDYWEKESKLKRVKEHNTFLRLVPNRSYNHKKSVEPYLCLFSERRFLQDPTNKNKQETPTLNMKMPPNRAVHAWTLCGGIYISQGRLLPSCFGLVKFCRISVHQNKR